MKKREMSERMRDRLVDGRAVSPGTPKACRLRRVSDPATREAEPNGAGQPDQAYWIRHRRRRKLEIREMMRKSRAASPRDVCAKKRF